MASLTFKGGDKLAAVLKEIADKAGKAGTLRVGFLEGATYPDGTSVPFVAAMNEFGHSVTSKEGDYFQMPRAFFRGMIAEKSPGWGESLGNLARINNYDFNATLGQMGEGIRGQLQDSIRKFDSVPLADSTIAHKGGVEKQLIDTAHMLNSADYEVNDK